MAHRERRQIAEWVGRGYLTRDGTRIGDVDYVITVFRSFETVRSWFGRRRTEEVPGSQELTFRIDHGQIDLWLLTGVALTLHTEDGRRIADVVHNGQRFVAASEVSGP